MSFNRTCMVSNIPLLAEDKVKVLFLMATGDYNSDKAILTTEPVYPWSGFTILGGISASATLGISGKIDFKKNINYDFLVEKINQTFKVKVQLEEVPQLISEGKLKDSFIFQENSFLNIAYIKEDVYESIIKNNCDAEKWLKKRFESVLKNKEEYKERLNNKYKGKELEENLEYFICSNFNVGFYNQYACNVYESNFIGLFKKLDDSLNVRKIFNIIKPDMLLIEGLMKNSILIAPKVLSDELDSFTESRENFYKENLSLYMKQKSKMNEGITTKKVINIIQEVNIRDIIEFFEYDYLKEEKKEVERFIEYIGHNPSDSLYISCKDFEKYPFLKHCLDDFDQDLLIKF